MSMNIPKQRLYRAMVRSGKITKDQIPEIDRKLSRDRNVQKQFLQLWRQKRGARFGSVLTSLIGWVRTNWDLIQAILGIAVLVLDEEPEANEDAVVEDNEIVTPPNPADNEDNEDELDKPEAIEDKEDDKPEIVVGPYYGPARTGDKLKRADEEGKE